MQSRNGRLALAAALVVLAVILFVVLRDSDDDGGGEATIAVQTQEQTDGGSAGSGGGGDGGNQQPPEPQTPVIVIRNGKPVGGVRELEFAKGDVIRFTVRSDVADEVHLHGYDVSKDVQAGGSVSFAVPADLEGIYEVELEERVEPIAEISVIPG